MSILEDFYYGNIIPYDKCFDRDSEHCKLLNIVTDCEEKINTCLDEEKKPLLSLLTDAQRQILSLEAKDGFINGWRLGIKLIADTFR